MRLFLVIAEMVVHTGDYTSEVRDVPEFFVKATDEAEALSRAFALMGVAATVPTSVTVHVYAR